MTNPLEELALPDLRARTSVKWRTYDPDVLPLWVAEMDVPLAPAVVSAVQDAVAAGDTGYAAGTGYAEALQQYTRSRWSWTFNPVNTALVADVMTGIVEVLKLLTRPGDAVVVNPPVYPPFFGFIEHGYRRVVEAPLSPEGRIDFDSLDRAFALARRDDAAAVFLLCNPHNPTGTVHTTTELEQVASLASVHGVRVVADEIHAFLELPGANFTPYVSVDERAFSLMSASKGWNLPGLKAAVVVPGERAVSDLARLPEEVSHGPSHLGVIAHTAALTHGGGWLDGLISGLDANRKLFKTLLDARLPDVGYHEPEATYLAWLDCRALGLGDDPGETFLRKGRVALSPGPSFGTGGAGFARLNLATSTAVLEEAVTRMAACV